MQGEAFGESCFKNNRDVYILEDSSLSSFVQEIAIVII